MTDPQDLLRLADAVVAYDPRQSPDNRADEMPLDLAIAKAFGRAPADAFVMRGSVTGYGCGDGVGGYGNCPVERYTRSLDAAMTLIDADTFLHVSRFDAEADGRSEAHVYPNRCVGDDYQAEAATPALALCAAALRARAHSTKDTISHD